jgi:hypothetical protein
MSSQTTLEPQFCERCNRLLELRQVKNPKAWSDTFKDMALGNFVPYQIVLKCPNCDQTAQELKEEPRKRITVDCEYCSGTGYVECGECDGEGTVERWEDEEP